MQSTPILDSNWLSDFDLYLFGEGKHHHIYEKLGAHLGTVEGVDGVHFAVWAPNADSVSVVGDFNNWDPQQHPMTKKPPRKPPLSSVGKSGRGIYSPSINDFFVLQYIF